MSGHIKQSQSTFIVRFWWEWQAEDPDQTMVWRGRIEHVQSGEGMSFHDASQLFAFIKRFVTALSLPTIDEK